jgi:hypothetical protein
MLPVLIANGCEFEPRKHKEYTDEDYHSIKNVHPKKQQYTIGFPDPDRAATIPGAPGKVTPLFNVHRPFICSCPFSYSNLTP